MRFRGFGLWVAVLALAVVLQGCGGGRATQSGPPQSPASGGSSGSQSPASGGSSEAQSPASGGGAEAPTAAATSAAPPPVATLGASVASHLPAVITGATPTATPTISTVFVIMMENHNWSAIKGSGNAPYINQTLLPMASHAEQYYNPPGNHPSLPNYLWLEAGTNFGIHDDGDPAAFHQSTTAHLVTLLAKAGVSWKSYQENIPGTTCPITTADSYAARHNPMVFFDDVTNKNDPHSAYCISHVRPYEELAADLQNNRTAQYNFITPNICHDMHNYCAPTFNPVRQGDSWLASAVPPILASDAYKNGGALIITWDEGEGSDGPIGMIVLSPFAKGHGYASAVHYTHSSTLRTIQEIFKVRPLLGDAANAADLSDLFDIPLD